ncbi:transposase [Streptomyces albus subsp. chlorinus]|nr:transposase [Streptomyces albus subsp. chlorinus]
MPQPVGRLGTKRERVLGEEAYSFRASRGHLRSRGLLAVIPQPTGQASDRRRPDSRSCRPPAIGREVRKQSNAIERCANKLRQSCGLATRHGRTAPASASPHSP